MKYCECKVQRPDLEAECALCGRPYKLERPRPDDQGVDLADIVTTRELTEDEVMERIRTLREEWDRDE